MGQDESKKIIKAKEFTLDGVQYIARLYIPQGRSGTYGEVVYSANGERPSNMKGIVREFLAPRGISISTDERVATHSAVRKLIDYLEKEEVSK